ncbi:unnamed protein product [Oppiella nova]|uniref:Phosphate acetyltransferase n=1 Tax=Oppiella nova TaxID=334625 RepID=A0A7R9L7I2_9ACAR|nr:unnamed protein product [Oppiella nova]CAG2155748.1 unnamed protein product [Oppiella nova]
MQAYCLCVPVAYLLNLHKFHSLATSNGIPLAGLVLTEHHEPNPLVLEFCQSAIKNGLPILHTPLSTFETAQQLANLSNEIPVDDTERADQVTRFVSSHIDPEWLTQMLNGDEPRTIQAAAICQSRGIAQCVLLAKPEAVLEVAKARNIELPVDLEIIDPDLIRENYVTQMVELRKGKLNELQAREQLQDTVVLGTMMLALDQVDGLVSGAIHTTANTVRPAFQLIKTAPEYSLVSSIFFMLLPDEVYVYGDCAINPDPDAEQLAEIAIQSADSAKAFGIDPRIAMISYSTGTSGAVLAALKHQTLKWLGVPMYLFFQISIQAIPPIKQFSALPMSSVLVLCCKSEQQAAH